MNKTGDHFASCRQTGQG